MREAVLGVLLTLPAWSTWRRVHTSCFAGPSPTQHHRPANTPALPPTPLPRPHLLPSCCRAERDLNRDFPDRFASPDMQRSGLEQPETAAIMDWTMGAAGPFVAAASMHEVGVGGC